MNLDQIIEQKIILRTESEIKELSEALDALSDRELSIYCRRLIRNDRESDFGTHYYLILEEKLEKISDRLTTNSLNAFTDIETILETYDGTYQDANEMIQKIVYICNEAGFQAKPAIHAAISSIKDPLGKQVALTVVPAAMRLRESNVPD